MIIGIVPDPLNDPDWPQIEAFLEPAAKRCGVPFLEENEEVWVVYDGPLEAAATARLTVEDFGEIVLVGGRDSSRWLGPLDWKIGGWMRREGKKRVRAYGRKGWKRQLGKLGWQVIGEREGVTAYERAL